MLLKPRISRQAPYGAFDLKINYQYNLLRATLITVALVGGLVGALFAAGASPKITKPSGGGVSDGGDERDTIRIFLEYPLNGKKSSRSGPEVTVTGPLKGIPVPVSVADSLDGADSSGTVEVSEFQLAGLISGGSGSGAGNPVGGQVALSGGIFPDVGEFVPHEVAPRALEWVIPEYPRLAKAARIEGVVWITALVDEDGKVRDVRIAKESGANAGFEEAAEAAAWECKFSPAIQNGNPIAVWVTFSFRFVLSGDF